MGQVPVDPLETSPVLLRCVREGDAAPLTGLRSSRLCRGPHHLPSRPAHRSGPCLAQGRSAGVGCSRQRSRRSSSRSQNSSPGQQLPPGPAQRAAVARARSRPHAAESKLPQTQPRRTPPALLCPPRQLRQTHSQEQPDSPSFIFVFVHFVQPCHISTASLRNPPPHASAVPSFSS